MDPTVIHRPAADTREPYAPEPRAPTRADDQVVVGDIPAQRPGFQPRPALLAQLDRASHGRPVVVLTGTSGLGKSQLAAAYARGKLAGGWRLIAWVNARDNVSLLAGLAAVDEAMALPGDASRPAGADAGLALRHRMEADGRRCLLVFDDVEDPGLLRPFVPAEGAARVLITGAREPAAELGTRVPVPVFSAEEALALLEGRTAQSDQVGAAAVAVELGHVPLALDQAAAVIAGQRLGYAAYLTKLRAVPAEDYLGRDERPDEQPHPQGVAKAVLISLEATRAADPLGVCTGVIEVIAMLSPTTVRRGLLRSAGQAGTLLGGGRRVAASLVDQALERLRGWSLLGFSIDGQVISMHCLVASVIRHEMARRERLTMACRAAAASLETSAAELVKSPDHAAAREMLGQVTALLDHAEGCPDDTDGKLAATLRHLRLLALDHLLGPGHPDTLTSQNSLAAADEDPGRGAKAVPRFEQTLAERERELGPDHRETMRLREQLARAYRDAGQIGDSIRLLQRSLADRERLLGAYHPSTLAARNNLASTYRAAGRAAEAVPLFELNQAACEWLLGEDHPRTVASRHNLDLARQEAGEAGGSASDRPR